MVRKKVNKTGCTATSQIWCPWRGLNTRPLPYQGSALPLSYMGANCFFAAMLPVGKRVTGAGEGNRTLVVSLEGFCSTIELHPPDTFEKTPCHTTIRESANNPKQPNTQHTKSRHLHPQKHLQKTWWRGKDSNLRRLSQQIYSLPPLTTWVPARNAMYEKSIYTMTVNRLHFFIVLMRKEEQTNPRTSPPPYQVRIYAGKCELVLSSKRPILLIKCSEVKSQN